MIRPETKVKGRPGIEGIGERVQCARLMLGWTQAALALRIMMNPTEITAIETGRRTPNSRTLRVLCITLSVSADYLLGLPEIQARMEK